MKRKTKSRLLMLNANSSQSVTEGMASELAVKAALLNIVIDYDQIAAAPEGGGPSGELGGKPHSTSPRVISSAAAARSASFFAAAAFLFESTDILCKKTEPALPLLLFAK